MLTDPLVDQYITVHNDYQDHSELSRLLAAAVVSRKFCEMLLTDPAGAIKNGFAGEHFTLSAEEYKLVLSARGGTLPELAQQLCKFFPAPQPIPAFAPSENFQLRI